MPKNTKKRTQVKDLPKAKKKLTKDEAKKVKGGARPRPSDFEVEVIDSIQARPQM